MYELHCRMVAPVSIQEAFEVFENPHNLARITPPWLNFRVTSSEEIVMRKDVRIEYKIRWMAIPIRWRTRIAEYDPPYSFVDEQEHGPYVLWRHRHTFMQLETGTLVDDIVRYQPPMGPLGSLVHDWLITRQLKEIFRFRHEALRGIWGGGECEPPVISVL